MLHNFALYFFKGRLFSIINFYYGESQKTKNVSLHDRNMGLPSNFYDKSMNSLRTKLRLNISLYQ